MKAQVVGEQLPQAEILDEGPGPKGLSALSLPLESNPGWAIDLMDLKAVQEIKVFMNEEQLQQAEQHVFFAFSADQQQWAKEKPQRHDNGLSVRFDEPRQLRYIHIRLEGTKILAAQEVEIYGPREHEAGLDP